MAQHPLWHVCGAALFILLVALHRQTKSSGVLVIVMWNLTGVILHELAHLLVGLLCRAQPTAVSLIPHRAGPRWRLGSVTFRRITPFNAVPVALAPLGLAALAYLVARNWFSWYPPSFAATLALYAAVFVLLYNALPSRQDLRVASNWQSILMYLPLAALVAWYLLWPTIRASRLASLMASF